MCGLPSNPDPNLSIHHPMRPMASALLISPTRCALRMGEVGLGSGGPGDGVAEGAGEEDPGEAGDEGQDHGGDGACD